MERTSKWPLAIRKTIARKQMSKPNGLVLMKETKLAGEEEIVNNTTHQSASLLDPTQMGHWDSSRSVNSTGLTESDIMFGLLAQLEKCERELMFIPEHTRELESAENGVDVNDVEGMAAEDQKGFPLELCYATFDSEMMSVNICCDEDVLPGEESTLLQSGHSHEVVPVATATPFFEKRDEYVQGILMREIHLNRNDDYLVRSWNDGGKGSSSIENAFQDFQASDRALSERSDSQVIELPDEEQVLDGNEIYVNRNDSEYHNKEVEYDDDDDLTTQE